MDWENLEALGVGQSDNQYRCTWSTSGRNHYEQYELDSSYHGKYECWRKWTLLDALGANVTKGV